MKQKIIVGLIEVFGEEDGMERLEISNLPPAPHKRVRTYEQEEENYRHLQAQSEKIKYIVKNALLDAGYTLKGK